jgi:cyclopropane-fatty-acyl-phospholipid synthase
MIALSRLQQQAGSLMDRTAEALFLKMCSVINEGRFEVTLPDGSHHVFTGGKEGPGARVSITDPACYGRLLRGGEIGLGEAYMDGLWRTDDLTSVLTLGIVNRRYSPGWVQHVNNLARLPSRRLHLRRRNSLAGSRRNIEAHYDLSNELFALFLDETMAYSSAVYQDAEQDLAEAQRNKFDLLCQKAGLRATDRVLEIGCGWGAFAMHAAQNYGCSVLGITISHEQLALARRRAAEADLQRQVEFALLDYRHASGAFDKIVSIEMFEAVGAEYFEAFFQKCDSLLRPGGRLVMQTISVPNRTFQALRDGVNWLQKYIFPGGMLPSLAQIDDSVRRTGLVISSVEDIAEHYVRTLREWRRRFFANLEAVRALGFDDRFVRMWEYYLAYAEAGFATRSTGDLQVVFEKTGRA